MSANAKTIFNKAVEELRPAFQVIEDKENNFIIKYGNHGIGILSSEYNGKDYNRIFIYTYFKSGKVKAASSWVINKGSYEKDKEAMELFTKAVIEGVYSGCDINYVRAFLMELNRTQ